MTTDRRSARGSVDRRSARGSGPRIRGILLVGGLLMLSSLAVAQDESATRLSPQLSTDVVVTEPEPEPVTSFAVTSDEDEAFLVQERQDTDNSILDLGPLDNQTAAIVLLSLAVAGGGVLVVLSCVLTAALAGRKEQKKRKKTTASVLLTEMEARHHTLESLSVYLMPEAAGPFTSGVAGLADMDQGFHAVSENLHLLPPRLSANIALHYSAVRRIAAVAKERGGNLELGATQVLYQDLAATFLSMDTAVRMLRRITG